MPKAWRAAASAGRAPWGAVCSSKAGKAREAGAEIVVVIAISPVWESAAASRGGETSGQVVEDAAQRAAGDGEVVLRNPALDPPHQRAGDGRERRPERSAGAGQPHHAPAP